MKACFLRRYGSPEVLEYGELPDPAPGAGEVLIEIHAASVNAADWKMRAGQYGAAVAFPHVPGRDFSGVIVSGAQFFEPGDAVFGVCEVPREGAHAGRSTASKAGSRRIVRDSDGVEKAARANHFRFTTHASRTLARSSWAWPRVCRIAFPW